MTGLGVGLIGTGYMGKCHALAWNAVAATFGDVARPRLVHLGEADQAKADEKAQAFGFVRASGDWRAVVADPEVDIVSITTPNAFHAGMAIAALEAGKHVWCEKPMATSLADAGAMVAAAWKSGRVTALGYNYIQNPAIRNARRLIAEGAIGELQHFRVEMDEDFMADGAAAFGWKSDKASGHGALDDFGVHALSLILNLCGPIAAVIADQAKPFATRPSPAGPRAVETHDLASVLLRLASGASGTIALNRSAWGRKGRIAVQIFGSRGMLAYDQERPNELQFFDAGVEEAQNGFRTILSGPVHPPYGAFIPAPGHGLGFNDLKVIEAREILRAIAGEPALLFDFAAGLAIEQAVDAMARSHAERRWIDLKN